MMNKLNSNPIFEIFWLLVALLTIIIGIYIFVDRGFKESYMFFIMAALATALYLARRSLRLKDKNN